MVIALSVAREREHPRCVLLFDAYDMARSGRLRTMDWNRRRAVIHVRVRLHSMECDARKRIAFARKHVTKFASQILTGFSSIDSNTGCRSPGELTDNLQHLRVAVCCSSARSLVRCSSLSSRVFSMAMTAWAAKFFTSSICLSVNGRTSWR